MTDEDRQDLYDTVGVDQGEIASPDDFKVQRDTDGDLQPVATEVTGLGKKIIHRPMTRGDVNSYLPNNLNLQEMTDRQKAAVVNDFLLEPDLGEVTEEDINEDFYAFADADVIVRAILDGSGYEILEAQGAEMMRKLEGNLDLAAEAQELQGSTDG